MIQPLDIASELAAIRPDLDAAIRRVLDSGVFIGGPEVTAFEAELATAAVIALVSGLVSALLVRRKLDHLDLVGVLKSSE